MPHIFFKRLLLKQYPIKILNIKGLFLIVCIILFSSTDAFSIIYYSAGNGDWNDPGNWSTVTFDDGTNTGTYPQAGDIAFIRARSIDAVNQDNECATLTIYSGAGNDSELFIENGYTLTVTGDLTLSANGLNKKALVNVFGTGASAGNLIVGGDVYLTKTAGGGDVKFTINEDATCTIAGSMITNYDAGDKNILIETRLNSVLNVGGNVVLDRSASNASRVELYLKGASEVDVNGNIQFIDVEENKTIVTVDNSSTLRIGGSFLRGPLGSNWGKLEMKSTSTLIYNGTTPQVFAEDAGQGSDNFTYLNVIIANTSGTIPQLTMENKVGGGAVINSSITFTSGVLETLTAATITILNGVACNDGNAGSYVDGPIKKIGDEAF
ncbi:hypothetical protein JYT72_03035, partial [Crocinitomix catalasitica]|nr:hypothetical protein [Crocinitomix catalasitica]